MYYCQSYFDILMIINQYDIKVIFILNQYYEGNGVAKKYCLAVQTVKIYV